MQNRPEPEQHNQKIWLSSPTMHGEELRFMQEAYKTNWMSTLGENIDKVEAGICENLGCRHAVALSAGTAALHLAVKLAGIRPGDHVFCTDMTFAATVNPVLYEGGIPVFIDTDAGTWNMDPAALDRAFSMYPDTKVVVAANLYGVPCKFNEILEICRAHGAVLIEDAAESLGATYKGKQTGTFGTYAVLSFNGNKIITGSSGGALVTEDGTAAQKVRKWSTQSRENAAWYQHEEIGYNYRMSNVIAGVVRGQLPYLREHIQKKKEIYFRYKEAFSDLPVSMNPYVEGDMEPNFWLSCLLIDKAAMCQQMRSGCVASFEKEAGKTCPTELLEVLDAHNIEGRPIWKPMHLQPLYRENAFIKADDAAADVGEDIFMRGLCLPSDIKMTKADQEKVIRIIRDCFA